MHYAYIFTNNDYQQGTSLNSTEITQDEDIFLVPTEQIITGDYIKSLEDQFPADKTKLVFFNISEQNLSIIAKDGKEILEKIDNLQLTFFSVINKIVKTNGTEKDHAVDEVTKSDSNLPQANNKETSDTSNNFDDGTSTPSERYQSVTSQLDPLTLDNQSTNSFEFATDRTQTASTEIIKNQEETTTVQDQVLINGENGHQVEQPLDTSVQESQLDPLPSEVQADSFEIANTQILADQATEIKDQNQISISVENKEDDQINSPLQHNNQNTEDSGAGVFHDEFSPEESINSALDSANDTTPSREEKNQENNTNKLSLQDSETEFKKEHESKAQVHREKVIAAIKDYLLTIKKVDITSVKHAVFKKTDRAPGIFNTLFEEEIKASKINKQKLDRGTIRAVIYLILLEKEVIPDGKTLLFIESLLLTKNSKNLRAHVVNFLSVGSGEIYKNNNAKIKEYNSNFIFNITEDSIKVSIDTLYKKDEQKYKENMDIVSQLNHVIENIAHDKTNEFENLGNILQFHDFIPGLKDIAAGKDVKSTLYYKSPISQPAAETSAELIAITIARIEEYLRNIKNIEPESAMSTFKNNEFPKPFLFFYTSRTGARRATAYLSLLKEYQNDPAQALHVIDALLHAKNSKELRWYVAEKILDRVAPNHLSSDILPITNTEQKINKAATTVIEKINNIAEREHLNFLPKASEALSAAIEKGQKLDQLNKIINPISEFVLIK